MAPLLDDQQLTTIEGYTNMIKYITSKTQDRYLNW